MATTLLAHVSDDVDATVESGPRLLTVVEFDRIPEDVFSEGERAELIEGVIYTKMGQNDPHRFSVHYTARALRAAFGSDFDLMMQSPLRLGESSRPEPDIFIFRGSLEDYEARRSSADQDAVLVIEVSDSTLAEDRGRKARLYAKHGIQEYWIVNLRDRTLEVRGGPRPDSEDYFETRVYREGESVPANGKPVSISDLLPKAEIE